jgi:hypothetical protein
MRYICLGQPEKTTVVEHRFKTGHNFDFSSISILDKATEYMDHMIKEAIKLHSSSFNRDGDFTLSWSWYSVQC